jgi:hypothetical protein
MDEIRQRLVRRLPRHEPRVHRATMT